MSDYRLSHLGSRRGEIYDQRFAQNRTAFYWENYEQPFLQQLLPQLTDPGSTSALDFACGTGRITRILNRYCKKVVGVDVSADMLEQARKALPEVTFCKIDLTRENFAEGPFDLITAFRFFLNAQPELRHQVLKALASYLRPEGVLLLNNHLRAQSINGWLTRVTRCAGLHKRNCLADKEFESLLQESGFKPQKIYSFCRLPGFHRFPPVNPRLWLRLEEMLARILPFKNLTEQAIYLCQR